MNEPFSIQLKILVERAVRPVRASTARKMQMREELLAHVTAVFEDELAKHPPEQWALEATARRFGDPAELTAQLQDSLSRWSRLNSHLDGWWGCPPKGLTLRGAVHYAYRVGATTAGLCLLVLFPVTLMKGQVGIVGGITLSAVMTLILTFFTFGLILVSSWIYLAVGRRAWLAVITIAALAGLFPPGLQFAACAIISADVAWSFNLAFSWSSLALSLLGMPLAMVGLAYGFDRELRQHQEWENLLVD